VAGLALGAAAGADGVEAAAGAAGAGAALDGLSEPPADGEALARMGDWGEAGAPAEAGLAPDGPAQETAEIDNPTATIAAKRKGMDMTNP